MAREQANAAELEVSGDATAGEAPLKRQVTDTADAREREANRVFALAADNHRRGRLDDALRGYARALQINPNIPDVYNNMGVALRVQGKLEAAIACYRRSLALRPNNPGVYSNMGNALRETGRLDLAVASHQQAVKLAPSSPEAIYNLGLVLRDLGHPEKALDCFEKSLSLRPNYVDCRWDRALSLLLKGEFEVGLEEYEWRWRLDRHPPREYGKPLWDGADIDGGTILLHHEQGFGDMIQFVRFVPMAKKRVPNVIVECQPELLRLFSTVEGVDKVVMRGGPLPDFNVYAPLMSLPRILGIRANAVPAETPYVASPELHTLTLAEPLDTVLKVGISWAGKRTHRNDRNRSVELSRFVDLMGLPGVAFYSLQTGEAAHALDAAACEALIVDVGSGLEDFSDTAAVIDQLDLVISVDTAVVHLAGAMNKPVWVALPFAPDWRWMIGREDSPWYPSVRLFRQAKPGDWDGVFTNLRRALPEAVEAKRASGAAG